MYLKCSCFRQNWRRKLLLLLFLIITVSSFAQHNESKVDSIIPLNNAALSMRYFKKEYSKPQSPPKYDSNYWKQVIIILNRKKVLSKEDFLQLDKNKIISIKEIINSSKDAGIDRVILLKTK